MKLTARKHPVARNFVVRNSTSDANVQTRMAPIFVVRSNLRNLIKQREVLFNDDATRILSK